jgi:transcriptional regulator with XRE-family HTH domain
MPNDFLTSNATIGDQIAERCKTLGISVSELCRRADVAHYKVSQWKKHQPASIDSLRRIEAVFAELEK